MNEQHKVLFQPIQIGSCLIKNRFAMAPMGPLGLADAEGGFNQRGIDYYTERAKGGTGLIITGVTFVDNEVEEHGMPNCPCSTHNPVHFIRTAREMTERIHAYGSKIFLQMSGGFGRVTIPTNLGEFPPVAPSPIQHRWLDKTCRALTVDEIHSIVKRFEDGAYNAKRAGFDGVQIHAVHEGYLLDQFTMANWNHRTDQYGGSFENRFRFPVEIVQEIKRQAGADFPVSLRYSVVSKTKAWGKGAMPYETDFEEFGRDMAESEKAVKYLEEAGYDMFNCDNGTYDAWYWAHPPQYMPDNCNLEYVEHIKKFTNCPVVCAGRMDPVKAAEEIAAGRLDAVAIARQNLVDHEWIHKILSGREDEIKPCIRCHNGCFNMSKFKGTANLQSMDDSLHLARCALNPTTMQHNKYKIVPTRNPKKVAIIGGGIGGMECALVLKQRGHTPVIFEKTNELGGLFLTASAMSFKENDKELIRWYLNEVAKEGIDVRFNTEVTDVNTLGGFDDIIVASGSIPRTMPSIPGFEKTLTFTELLKDKKEVGDKVLFIGGGQSSCEAAYDLVLQGKHPIIVEYAGDLVAAQATCLANTSFLRDAMEYHKVPTYLESTVTEIKDNGVTVKNVKTGETFFVECDDVVNGIGFVPTPVGGKDNKQVFRVGDCVAIGNLRTVIWRAWDVCMKI